MLNYLKKIINRNEVDFTDQAIKLKDCIIHGNLIILKTTAGQFTFELKDCDFAGESDVILFLFSRKNEHGQVENLDLRIDNTGPYKHVNSEIILKIKKAKLKK
ncbi:hypothetical protein KWF82_18515 [Acinetobacter baumannii]